ncbi:GTPase Era, partial [Syntrophomonas wolfei]
ESFILDQLKDARVPVFLLVNKIDLVSEQEVKDYIQIFNQQRSFSEVVSISAACGTNLQLLLDKTLDALPEGPLYYPEDDLTDQPIYLLIAELIREKALMLTHDEVPHSLAVEVEEFKKQSNGKVYLRAAIYMERDSQKGIVIGKKGQMLKTIGEQARQDIESLLDTAVYLDLWVKVKKNWRDNENTLNQLGYRM